MASTAEARRLTEAHRVAQTRIGAQTAQLMRTTWALLDPADLDGTVGRWLQASQPIIRAQRVTSARTAAAYYRAFRALETRPDRVFAATVVDAVSSARVLASLAATGPARVKAATATGATIAAASNLGLTGSADAAMRLVLDAGRQTITTTAAADDRALGWARAAGGDGCAFCLMLASRGPVYSEDTVDFEAHDRCSCGAEPVFDADSPWPPGSAEARELWDEATAGERDQLNAFRRALAGT